MIDFEIWFGLAVPFNQRHRQFLEYLRAGEWVRSINLPDQPKLKLTLLRNQWIEAQESGCDVSYRITAKGITEMGKPRRLR
ncbi:hypothetical protein ACE10X_30695 [Bradyrhizobium sp. Pha-3]|uniref:hypothetical protein n=1 Tax=Bradyrhizobium sp. Pha-3 TaxID=208375 RepID=UPI0035D52A79